MIINVKLTVRTALATFVAGAVANFVGCGERPADELPAANDVAAAQVVTNMNVRSSETAKRIGRKRAKAVKKPSGSTASSKKLPDDLMRLLVDDAVNANDYKRLSVLLGKIDRIGDPAIRMRLLEGLNWFEETAVEDAIPFLIDADEGVAAFAAEIVSSRISSIPKPQQREKVYVASLKLMPDSPDRDILISMLENERKFLLMHVMRDMEQVRTSDSDLWDKLKAAYESACGRPYVSYVDALLHYNPRSD